MGFALYQFIVVATSDLVTGFSVGSIVLLIIYTSGGFVLSPGITNE